MILFSHTFSSLHLFFQFAGWPSALKKNLLKHFQFPPKHSPFFLARGLPSALKKILFSHTFTSSLLLTHFQFPPSFFFSSRLAFTILKKLTFQTLKHSPPSFLFLPLLSPFFYTLFLAPFQHSFL